MGYNVYITRKKDWADEGNDISYQEWVAVIESDPELIFGPELLDEKKLTMARWGKGLDSNEPWLCWSRSRGQSEAFGFIDTKNPDPRVIEKMIQIAVKLGATVQGEHGEIYPGPETDRYWQHSSPSENENHGSENIRYGVLYKVLHRIFNRR